MDYREHSVKITVRNDGPKSWKQYRRGGKTFWRNYKRDVPGGVSFIERFDAIQQTTMRAMRDRLAEQIFTTSAALPPR